MESYTFELEGNVFGFFQRNDNDCLLYIDDGMFSEVRKYDWGHWKKGENNYHENYPDTVDLEETARAIGYFSWHQLYDYCKYRPRTIGLSKKTETGLYYPRMNKGEPKLYHQQIKESQVLDEVRSFTNICTSLTELFNYIDPDERNLNCFGSKAREILIIACTEVEYLLQSFLVENNYCAKNGRFTTKDYVKCLDFLKLNEYSVELVFYPSLKDWSPFRDWSESKATTSLAWYDAYNSVKHNRGANKQKATLKFVVNSVAAIHIILVAQYGYEIFGSPLQSNFSSIFKTIKYPNFSTTELQCPLMNNEKILWTKKGCLF
ncbi:hypothetical protein LGC28_000633 [Serratia marcescens]|nr:hypothetical protein [Serratia marcescens]